jgi:hypothetical protein
VGITVQVEKTNTHSVRPDRVPGSDLQPGNPFGLPPPHASQVRLSLMHHNRVPLTCIRPQSRRCIDSIKPRRERYSIVL